MIALPNEQCFVIPKKAELPWGLAVLLGFTGELSGPLSEVFANRARGAARPPLGCSRPALAGKSNSQFGDWSHFETAAHVELKTQESTLTNHAPRHLYPAVETETLSLELKR